MTEGIGDLKTKQIIIINIVFIIAVAFAKIGFATQEIEKNSNNITIWIMYQDDARNGIKESIRLYKAKPGNETLNVQFRIIPWEHAYKMFSTSPSFKDYVHSEAGDIFPDIIQVPSSWLGHLIMMLQILHPLEGEVKGQYSDQLLKTCTINDHVYCLPWFIDIRVLYYRKDIFKKAFGKEDGNEIDTWEGFLGTCEKLHQNKNNVKLVQTTIEDTGKNAWVEKGVKECAWMINANHVEPNERDVLPVVLPGCKDAGWNMLHDIIMPHFWSRQGNKDKLIDQLARKSSMFPSILDEDIDFYANTISRFVDVSEMRKTREELEDEFILGLYAMHVSGPFLIKRIEDRWGKNWGEYFGIASLPATESKSRGSFLGGSHLGLVKEGTSPFNPKAEAFLRFLASDDEAQQAYCASISMIPALPGSAEKMKATKPYLTKFDIAICNTYPPDPIWFSVEGQALSIMNWLKYGRFGYISKWCIGGVWSAFCKHYAFVTTSILFAFLPLVCVHYYKKFKKQKTSP